MYVYNALHIHTSVVIMSYLFKMAVFPIIQRVTTIIISDFMACFEVSTYDSLIQSSHFKQPIL